MRRGSLRHDAASKEPQQQERSVFELHRFNIIEVGVPNRIVLGADARATQELLLWYGALVKGAAADEKSLLIKLKRGDFGMFPARNLRETRILAGDQLAPLPAPLAEVSLMLPRHTAPTARAALEHYLEKYCQR